MTIVATFAVMSEFAPWRRLRAFGRVDRGRPIYQTRIGDADVFAVITGIGMRNVNGQFEDLLRKPADVCIASGLAGGLKREYRAGTVLVARAVKTSSTQETVNTVERLVRIGIQCGATPVDSLQSVDAVLTSSLDRQRLAVAADAVDIESFRVITEALRCGVPAVAIRAVSDPVEKDVPLDFNQAINEQGAINWVSTLFQAAKTPRRFPEMLRFGRDSLRAARNLAFFLDRYVTEIS